MSGVLTVGSLFSGIEGIGLGLELASPRFQVLWQVERNEYARAILQKWWPETLRLEDVRHVDEFTVPRVDVLTGGFPCQPHSTAGQRKSSDDERDLWPEFERIIRVLRPRWVVAENVRGLLSSHDPAGGRSGVKGAFFGRVLRDLAALGYDAEWHCFPASAVGALHERYRVWIVAHAQGAGTGAAEQSEQWNGSQQGREALAHAYSPEGGQISTSWAAITHGQDAGRQKAASGFELRGENGCQRALADAGRGRGQADELRSGGQKSGCSSANVAHAHGLRRPPAAQRSGDTQPGSQGQDDQPGNAGQSASALADAVCSGRGEQHAPAQPGCAGHSTRRGDTPDWAGGSWEQPSPVTEWEEATQSEVERGVRYLADGVPERLDGYGMRSETHAIMGFIYALRRVLYADACESHTRQALLLLREITGEKEVQWPTGGFERLSQAEVLRCPLHGAKHGAAGSVEIHAPQAGASSQERSMRVLWEEQKPPCASQGWESRERCTCQLDDALRILSSQMALGQRTTGGFQQAQNLLRDLWQASQREGLLPDALSAVAEVWRSLTNETPRRFWFCPDSGRWGVEYVTQVKKRVPRLEALGNAVVPEAAQVIGYAIADAEEYRRLTGRLPERIVCQEHLDRVCVAQGGAA